MLLLIILLTAGQVFADYNDTCDYDPTASDIRKDLDFNETIVYDGYIEEIHYVYTSDGYIIQISRLKKQNSTAWRDPMIIYHGLFLSKNIMIALGRNRSLPYIFLERGYDVWLPNVRGNTYGRNHTTLNPDTDPLFWNFTFIDMALKDLPAIVDYILLVTGWEQLLYVGHSQAMSMFLLLCMKIPEYNAKFRASFGFSTTTWLFDSKMVVLETEALVVPALDILNQAGYDVEILEYGGVMQQTAEYLCGSTRATYPECTIFVFGFFGYNDFEICPDVLTYITNHEPSGTSLDNFRKWGQIKNDGFYEENYGELKNWIIYGQKDPPEFPWHKITADLKFFMSKNDVVSTPEDNIKYLFPRLTHFECLFLDDDYFGHLDYVAGKSTGRLCAEPILEYLETGVFQGEGQIIKK